MRLLRFDDFVDTADGDALLRPWPLPASDRSGPPNHSGKPCSRLKPPGGSFGLSVVLLSLSTLAAYMCVVKGVMSGWKMSVENVTRGGARGYASGNIIWNRRTAGAYGP